MITKMAKTLAIVVSVFLTLLLPDGIFGAREEHINKIEVFVSAYCYRINNLRGPEVLLLKRSAHRELYPSLWECVGGSVRENESLEAAAKRQLKEETGINANRWKLVECFEVEVKPGIIVPGVAFSCKADEDVRVEIDPKEHTDYRWVRLDELENFQIVSHGMYQSIVKLLMLQSKLF